MADGRGGKLHVLPMDVSNLASIRAAAAELKGKSIDLLLNNAGVGGPRGQTIGNIDYETCANVLKVNTLGPIRVAEAFVDNVAQSERKLIVTITSGMGSITDNASGGAFAYRSSDRGGRLCVPHLRSPWALETALSETRRPTMGV
jgi:NAD(P)-dependent dehydrogenase (short-subunit alcohol dehydrogenase family)